MQWIAHITCASFIFYGKHGGKGSQDLLQRGGATACHNFYSQVFVLCVSLTCVDSKFVLLCLLCPRFISWRLGWRQQYPKKPHQQAQIMEEERAPSCKLWNIMFAVQQNVLLGHFHVRMWFLETSNLWLNYQDRAYLKMSSYIFRDVESSQLNQLNCSKLSTEKWPQF